VRHPASKVVLITMLFGLLAGCGQGEAMQTDPPARPSPAVASPSASPAAARLWALRRGEAKSDQLWSVAVDRDGNVYATGYSQSPPTAQYFDIVTWKFGPDGHEIWRSQWGKAFEEMAFVVTPANAAVLVGGLQRDSADTSRSKQLVVALDPVDGHPIWDWTWTSGVGYHEIDGIVVDGDAAYVSGWAGSTTASGEVSIAKLSLADGRAAWVRSWGGPNFDEADGQLVVDNQYLYVTGRYGGKPPTPTQALVARFQKTTGDYVSHVTWGDGSTSDGLGMTSDGTWLYVTGFTTVGTDRQIMLLKLDKSLSVLWARTWGGKDRESAGAVAMTAAGDILVAGHTFSRGSGSSDVALLKFSSSGTLVWEQVWGGPGADEAHGLAVAGDAAYVAGETENGSAGLNDGLLLKATAGLGQLPAR
jgi:hypothetical protein